MKALLVNKFLYPKGGDAISTLATAELLRANGHEVALWGMKDSANPEYPNSEYFIENVNLEDATGMLRQFHLAGKLLYSLEAKRKVNGLIRDGFRPDIVHLNNFAHQISPSILHVFRKCRIPVVMTMHDYKLVCGSYSMLAHGKPCEACRGGRFYQCFIKGCVKDSRPKSLLNTIEMYLHHGLLHIYDLVDVFISPSRFLKQKVESMGFTRPVQVLPNFIHPDEFRPCYEPQESTICYVGRLSKEKGLATLLDAKKRLPAVRLKIIGDGPLRANLEEKARIEGIANVEFAGHRPGSELKEAVRGSLFAVLPSECYENNPRSIIEAFALGKPVVGARIGGIPELVSDGKTGLTFRSADADDLAQKIRTLAGQPQLVARMGCNARRFVEEELNPQKHYEGLMRIYRMAGVCSTELMESMQTAGR